MGGHGIPSASSHDARPLSRDVAAFGLTLHPKLLNPEP